MRQTRADWCRWRIRISGLSDDLLFTLLVIHDGHATATVDRVDPAKGLSAAVTLKPRVPVEDTTRVVRGRVVNLQGHALRDAVVEQQGAFLAAKLFTEATGADRKTMAVAEGATVRGRLLYQGKPVSSAEVGW